MQYKMLLYTSETWTSVYDTIQQKHTNGEHFHNNNRQTTDICMQSSTLWQNSTITNTSQNPMAMTDTKKRPHNEDLTQLFIKYLILLSSTVPHIYDIQHL